jgi:hypothetical protein
VQTAGRFDTDCELTIWVSGRHDGIKVEIAANLAVEVQKTLADCMFAQ